MWVSAPDSVLTFTELFRAVRRLWDIEGCFLGVYVGVRGGHSNLALMRTGGCF